MKHIYIAIILFCASILTQAQDNAFMLLKGVPQTTQINPAFRPVKGGYFALPALGSVKINGSNTGFSWSDVIRSGTGLQADSLVIDLDNLAENMQANNLFATEASVQIVGFGFRIKKAFITFDVNHRLKAKMNYPESLLDLRYGNYNYDQDVPINHSLSDLFINTMDYHEVALGISHPITEKLTFGARIKYLIGVANAETEKFNVGIETFEDGRMLMTSDAAIRTSYPLVVDLDEDGYIDDISTDDDADVADILMGDNRGFGFDAGLTYQLNEKWTFGAAVNDIGFINWKSNTNRFFSNGTFEYNGVDISQTITGDDDDVDYLEDLADDFEDSFKFSSDESSYKTNIMGSFNVTAQYQPKEWLDLGAIYKSYFVDGKTVPETTLAVGLNPGKALSTVFTYSLMKNAPANFGTGIALKLGAFQIYAATDNLNSLIVPDKAKYVNARLGINFVFNGRKKKQQTEDELIVVEEE
ncbi:hypothetical protein J1N10_05100 [Carboxylicivirga sp. A043]|uniref:DUF5723 family protein n=1 Tax=Carboxylicivirga litoralis TaxID=2816963 RepID=UPI0021CB553D|nr:DUF5723 family protein [Carboxylicivirga sp. A043]MCU4155341.1 hypothetical protein [Carboxylicivirga sp. A043]